jgi:fatty acid desaturase
MEYNLRVMSRPTLGFTLAAAYAAACLLAVAYVVFGFALGAGGGELAGLLILILGLPWSILCTFVVLALGSSSAWLLATAYALSCVLNGWLLYKLGARLGRGR